ncbi:hypothetical protein [Clostridium perfringens]|uniref:hypothetical protein n=1 Tax=Clostridium perfringens TaxID=1502 RepID=UPI003F4280E2
MRKHEIKDIIIKLMKENVEELGFMQLFEDEIKSLSEELHISEKNIMEICEEIESERVSTKAKVILNEQHSLLPNQQEMLNKKFGENGWEIFSIPSNGWTLREQLEKVEELKGSFEKETKIVFASPLPIMIAHLVSWKQWETIFIFHNDKREKKELSNGKIIFTVAQKGWQLVEV